MVYQTCTYTILVQQTEVYVKKYKTIEKPVPPHVHVRRILYYWLKAGTKKTKVITLVRDPIARKISGYFEMRNIEGVPTYSSKLAKRYVQSRLSSRKVLDDSYEWFEKEIKGVLGIDIFRHEFDKKEGYGHIKKDGKEVLILTLEKLDKNIEILSKFSGVNLKYERSRVRQSDIYNTVKKKAYLPKKKFVDYMSTHGCVTSIQIKKLNSLFVDRV